MENLINERITELETYVTNLRTVITAINKEILENRLVPDKHQKMQIELLRRPISQKEGQGVRRSTKVNLCRKEALILS